MDSWSLDAIARLAALPDPGPEAAAELARIAARVRRLAAEDSGDLEPTFFADGSGVEPWSDVGAESGGAELDFEGRGALFDLPAPP